MGMLSRAVRFGLVWAAALLTPVAGTSHVDCVCADGHVKPFCLSFSLVSRPCCRGTGSCSPDGGCSCCGTKAPVRETHGKACCAHARQRGTPAGNHIAGTTCRKIPAEADTQITPPVSAAAHDHATVVALAPASVPPPAAAPAVAGCSLSWQSYRLPPPTDRVIAFQHLVI